MTISREHAGGAAAGIVEVAARAGVSPATVSRALRGIAGVSPKTRTQVERAAAELGYVASPSASALAMGRTSAIGVLAPWVSRWFFGTLIEGIHDVVTDEGYDLLLYPIGPEAAPHNDAITSRGLDKRVDGVLGVNVPLGLRPGGRHRLRVPVVTVGSAIEGLSGVKVDDVQVGYLATRHLLDLGHRGIVFVGLDPDDAFGFAVAADRYRGYQKALREAGLTNHAQPAPVTGFAVEGGEAAMQELLDAVEWNTADLPTAVVAVSDEVAMGLIYAARQRGIRVPQDLSVIGVDDHDMAYLYDLTTIGQPVREQGRIAARMLFDQIRSGTQGPPEIVRVQPGLITRNTTAPPRT